MHVKRSLGFSGLVLLVSLLGLSAQAQTTVAGSTPGQFAVSPSGAATYRIPIQVPPGVAGMQPKLELVYNSQSGNGMLGMGWGISGLSAITRCPRTRARDGEMGGVNFDANDRFCMDGQRLVLVGTGTYGTPGTEYRTEIESFSKITANGAAGNGPASFTVMTKAGLILEYGNSTDSRIEAIKAAGSSTTWPPETVRVWAQNKVTDVKLNTMTLSYDEDVANGAYYPKRIDYTGNAISTPALVPTASVQFVPTTMARIDVETGYQAGAVVKSAKRIGNIQTFIGSTMVKDYRLVYETSAATNRSRVTNLTECDGVLGCQFPQTWNWRGGSTPIFNDLNLGNWGNTGLAPQVFSGDFNGDGKTDMCWCF